MIINKNNDIIWNTSNIMIEAMSERNKFLINEWNTKKSMIDIELFKKEYMQLLTIMFTVMRKTVPAKKNTKSCIKQLCRNYKTEKICFRTL